MRLWPNYVQLVTLKKSGINSVEDLKGKRVGVGAANSGVGIGMLVWYMKQAYGMTYADSKVDYSSYGEAIDQMKNGQWCCICYFWFTKRDNNGIGYKLWYGYSSNRWTRER